MGGSVGKWEQGGRGESKSKLEMLYKCKTHTA